VKDQTSLLSAADAQEVAFAFMCVKILSYIQVREFLFAE
jgi:hypothetical protein